MMWQCKIKIIKVMECVRIVFTPILISVILTFSYPIALVCWSFWLKDSLLAAMPKLATATHALGESISRCLGI